MLSNELITEVCVLRASRISWLRQYSIRHRVAVHAWVFMTNIGFACNSPEQVKQLHDIAVANDGTRIEDDPSLCEGTMSALYYCCFLDPDGNKICGIHRPD
jgi:hypothetical protein